MSTPVIPDKFLDLFAKKAFAHLATLMPSGEPQVTPVWIDYDGERVVFNTAAGRQKDKNLQRDGRVSMSIIDPDNPYRYLEVRGRVTERTTNGGPVCGHSRFGSSARFSNPPLSLISTKLS